MASGAFELESFEARVWMSESSLMSSLKILNAVRD